LEHATELAHCPLELQVCTAFPLHRVLPGPQTPVQTPLEQTWLEHATELAHCPLELQVCTAFPLHRVLPGAQTPVQTPAEQTWLEHATGFPHRPLALHVCTAFPLHCLLPGAQRDVWPAASSVLTFDDGFALSIPESTLPALVKGVLSPGSSDELSAQAERQRMLASRIKDRRGVLRCMD